MEYSNKAYSDVVTFNDFQFRYSYAKMQLQWVIPESDEIRNENELYLTNNVHSLYDVEDGFVVIDTVPMMPGTFENVEKRENYISKWVDFTREKAAEVLNLSQEREEEGYDREA